MIKKNLLEEMQKVRQMAQDKIKSCGGFIPFAIAYSDRGNFMIQMEPWRNHYEKLSSFEQLIIWLKQQGSYMFLFGVSVVRRDDTSKNAILIIGKTPDKTIHMLTEYEKKDGQYLFKDNVINSSDNEYTNFLQTVFMGAN